MAASAPPAARSDWNRPRTGLPAYDHARFSVAPRTSVLRPLNGGPGLLEQSLTHHPSAPTEIEVPPGPVHTLCVFLAADGLFYEGRIAGSPVRLAVETGSVVLLPAGADSRWVGRGAMDRVLHLHLDPAWLAALADDGAPPGGAARLPPLVHAPDPGLAGLVAALEVERAAAPLSAAFVEHWCMLAAWRVMALPAKAGRADYAIAPRRLAEVKAFVEANLARDIGLAEMAAVARLSRFHFVRAFKRETGVSPHAFLTARRVEAAKRALRRAEATHEDIARACGFSGATHLRSAFRRIVGMTPGRWRRASDG